MQISFEAKCRFHVVDRKNIDIYQLVTQGHKQRAYQMPDAAQNVTKYRTYTQWTYHHHDSFTIGKQHQLQNGQQMKERRILSGCQRLRIITSKGHRGRHAPEVRGTRPSTINNSVAFVLTSGYQQDSSMRQCSPITMMQYHAISCHAISSATTECTRQSTPLSQT